jgi:hypothetical protein
MIAEKAEFQTNTQALSVMDIRALQPLLIGGL